ncbi:unnamed protein product, partial [Symbiodinium sp. CCMP2592]
DEFKIERAEKQVLRPNWMITAIPGVQKSFMQVTKWELDRMAVVTPKHDPVRRAFLLE